MTMNDIRVARQYTQTIAATPDQVFPLLCPVREADYLPGWKYCLVYSQSGLAELGCVFTTPNESGAETTWIITEHQPSSRVGFVRVRPEMLAARLLFTLKSSGASTELTARYEYTAVSGAGAAELAGYTDAWFAAKMQRFGACLEHCLRTGTMLVSQ
jgi:hypothetical protein